MVRKRDKLGGYYHEPPYTEAETEDLHARWDEGPVAFTRPAPVGPQAQVEEGQPPVIARPVEGRRGAR